MTGRVFPIVWGASDMFLVRVESFHARPGIYRTA